MTKKQDGTDRKGTRQPAGHRYPSNRKTTTKNVTETSQASALCELVERSDEEATNDVDVDDMPLSDISLRDYNSSDDYESDPDKISFLNIVLCFKKELLNL